jgi:hypothetical protein
VALIPDHPAMLGLDGAVLEVATARCSARPSIVEVPWSSALMLEHIGERDATTDVMRPWRQRRPEALARVPAREDGAITQAVLNALS